MPAATPATVRGQVKQGALAPIYLIVGDDEAEMARLTADISAVVEDELRAFNVERLYATDKSVSARSIAESARMLPMMSERRVVVVLRAERILKPKRRGKADEEETAEQEAETAPESDALEAYAKSPEPQTVLILVATDVDRTRRLYKALQKTATIVECWGLKGGKEASVYLCKAGAESDAGLVAAKVYRPRSLRNLKNDGQYRAGRVDLDAEGKAIVKSADVHAMAKRSSYGEELRHQSWISYEFQTLELLRDAGADDQDGETMRS